MARASQVQLAGREPRGQHWLAYGLLGALVLVVVGSMVGEWIGIFGWDSPLWAWFGDQGFKYLDLGRFWQCCLPWACSSGWQSSIAAFAAG